MQIQTTIKPVAAIAIPGDRTKNQLPLYGDTYYLRDGQEFIIMLHNPTRGKVAAKIFINGTPESSMLVLKPGQRVWVERFIDTDRKFLFETYDIEDTAENTEATKNNGQIRVEFYAESPKQPIVYIERTPQWPYNLTTTPVIGNPYINVGGGTGQNPNSNPTYLTNCFYSSVATSGTSGVFGNCGPQGPQGEPGMVETGRVELGEKSNQEFGISYDDFCQYHFHHVEFKLVPEKYRPAESVKQYCTQCGRARKKGDAFCGTCGTKY